MTAIEVRPLGPDEFPFLRRMLAIAAYWREPEAPSDVDAALSRDDLASLLDGWGHECDVAIVALKEGALVGGAWFRTCVRSYGFVDEQTPELGVAVEPAYRRQGIARRLLGELAEAARGRGIHRLSLSVELENPARQLYLESGFEDHQVDDSAATMVLALADA